MKKLLLTLSLLVSTTLVSQEIYIVNNLTELKIINTTNFSVTDLFTLGITTVDLAFSPSGQLYGITGEGEIVEIDLVNESFDIVATLPDDDLYTALFINSENQFITSKTIAEELYSFNLATQELILLGNGIATPGDITYFKGNYMYPGIMNEFIKTYNGDTVLDVGCGVNQLYTFVNVFGDCNNEIIYGIDNLGRVYLYDFLNQTVEQVAFVGPSTGNVFGGATVTEYMASNCDSVDLDEVVCGLSVENVSSNPFHIFPNPTSSEVTITTLLSIQEFTFELHNIQGQLVSSGTPSNNRVSLQELSSGIYFISLKDLTGAKVHIEQLIKK